MIAMKDLISGEWLAGARTRGELKGSMHSVLDFLKNASRNNTYVYAHGKVASIPVAILFLILTAIFGGLLAAFFRSTLGQLQCPVRYTLEGICGQ